MRHHGVVHLSSPTPRPLSSGKQGATLFWQRFVPSGFCQESRRVSESFLGSGKQEASRGGLGLVSLFPERARRNQGILSFSTYHCDVAQSSRYDVLQLLPG